MTIKTAGGSKARYTETPEPINDKYVEFKKFIESSRSFSSLPEAIFFDELKHINFTEHWKALFSSLIISYCVDLQPCLIHEHKKFTSEEKNSIKSLLSVAGHFFGSVNHFTLLFSQHGTLDMLKWMEKNKMIVDVKNTDSYKHSVTCCQFNALEISIVEGHKETSIWLKQQSDDWNFNFANVIFWCYIYNDDKLKTKKHQTG